MRGWLRRGANEEATWLLVLWVRGTAHAPLGSSYSLSDLGSSGLITPVVRPRPRLFALQLRWVGRAQAHRTLDEQGQGPASTSTCAKNLGSDKHRHSSAAKNLGSDKHRHREPRLGQAQAQRAQENRARLGQGGNIPKSTRKPSFT